MHILIALEHKTIDFKVSMNKLKQQLRQELIANKTLILSRFSRCNIVNDFDQYMRTRQYNSSICDLLVRLLSNALKISANILQKDSVNN